MSNTLTINDVNAVRVEQREKTITYALALTGSYVQAVRGSNVGEVMDLTKVTSTQFLPEQFWGPVGPRVMYLLNTGITGYSMSVAPGADALHWLLVIFSGVATQLAAGTYAANAPNLLTDLDIKVEARGRVMD